jgi:hypothetical protein
MAGPVGAERPPTVPPGFEAYGLRPAPHPKPELDRLRRPSNPAPAAWSRRFGANRGASQFSSGVFLAKAPAQRLSNHSVALTFPDPIFQARPPRQGWAGPPSAPRPNTIVLPKPTAQPPRLAQKECLGPPHKICTFCKKSVDPGHPANHIGYSDMSHQTLETK